MSRGCLAAGLTLCYNIDIIKIMKNTIEKGKFSFLVYQTGNKFIGICKETGYVEESDTLDGVIYRLNNGTKAILKSVMENPGLLPSINQRPPLKYFLLFYLVPIIYGFKNLRKTYTLEKFQLSTVELCK